jgi:hypothetical protein
MKLLLRIGGIFFVLLGILTILFYGYFGYKAASPYHGYTPQVGQVIFLVVMGFFLLVTGIGLIMLKKIALYATCLISVLGLWGTCMGAIHGNVVQIAEFLIFVVMVACSVIYLLEISS